MVRSLPFPRGLAATPILHGVDSSTGSKSVPVWVLEPISRSTTKRPMIEDKYTQITITVLAQTTKIKGVFCALRARFVPECTQPT